MFTFLVLVKQSAVLQKNNFHMPINRLNSITEKSTVINYTTVTNKYFLKEHTSLTLLSPEALTREPETNSKAQNEKHRHT